MTIVFNNPHGSPVEVPIDETVVVDIDEDGNQVRAATGPDGGTLMTTVMSEERMDDPMGMTQEREDMMVSSQLNGMEDAMTNPPKQLFTAKNLRLQTAISGKQAFMGQVGRVFEGGLVGDAFRFAKATALQRIPEKTSVRDSPFLLQLARGDQWYRYLTSLRDSPIDVGAELSATVSPSQRIAIAMFVKEWEQDPGHRTLLRRAAPGSDPNELILIGNMVYDIMTGRGPNPAGAKGYGSFAYDKMFRLAYDMLLSLPINFYNTYTLFQLEADEGGKIYSEVVSNYTPLELSEVGMVLELRQKLAEYGPAYANTVIGDTSVAAEASALMTKAVSAYSHGDTVTVRSVLNYLQEPPFYYMTPSSDAKTIFEAKGDTSFTGVRLKQDTATKAGLPVFNGLVYLKGMEAGATDKASGTLKTKDPDKKKWMDKSFEVIQSPFDNTVMGVVTLTSKDKFTFAKGATKSKDANRQQKRDASAEIAEALGNPRGNSTHEEFSDGQMEESALEWAQKRANETGKPYNVYLDYEQYGDAGWGATGMDGYYYFIAEELANLDDAIEGENAHVVHPQLNNPRGKPQGRGKFLELQIHPKTQLNMKLRATSKSGTGDKRHGAPPKGKDGSQNKWSMGLYNLLNTRIDAMNYKMRKDKSKKQKYPNISVMVHGGKHKKTGNWAPYRIKLPKSHFVKQRLPDGTEVIGMKKSLSDKELVAAWQKFTDEYGMFKVQRKDNEMYFIPHKRGAYYDKVRRQIGKAKGSR